VHEASAAGEVEAWSGHTDSHCSLWYYICLCLWLCLGVLVVTCAMLRTVLYTCMYCAH